MSPVSLEVSLRTLSVMMMIKKNPRIMTEATILSLVMKRKKLRKSLNMKKSSWLRDRNSMRWMLLGRSDSTRERTLTGLSKS
jgi:hypothetical protein